MKRRLYCLFVLLIVLVFFVTGCKSNGEYKYEKYEDGIKIISVSDKIKGMDALVLPDEIDGKKVYVIGERAFYNSKIQFVSFSKHIKMIEESAFAYSRLLQTVSLNEGLEYIGMSAFQYCHSLFLINIPSTVSIISDYAFEKCSFLKELKFDYVKKVNEEDNKIYDYHALKHIGNYAFYGADFSQRKLYFDFDLDYIGKLAFSSMNVTLLQFKSVNKVDDFAFAYSHYLQTISFGNDDAMLGIGLFYHCLELRLDSLNIGPVTMDGSNAIFQGYPNLIHISLSSEIVIEKAFMDCYYLKTVTISNTVKLIDKFAFARCYQLEEIIIPENVEEIEQNAFGECHNLKKLTVLGNPKISILGIFYNPTSDKIETKVYCKQGTYIQQYCIDNNINYEIIET